MEREIHSLSIESSNNTAVEEEKPLSEKENVLDLQMTGIKTKYMNCISDVKTEMRFDETFVSIDFPIVKNEVDVSAVYKEGNVLHLNVTEIKTEYMNPSYVLKSEMTFEESPVPIDFPVLKSEAEKIAGSEIQFVAMMEVIKMEVDVDPLAIQSSDNTNTDGKKPLLEEGHLLDLHMAGIKTESVDHTYDFTSGNKVEESAVASNFVTKKCKAEEKYDVDAVKDELKLEVTAEENEILINSFADMDESTVISEYSGFAHDYMTICQTAENSVSTEKMVRLHSAGKQFKCNVCEKSFSCSRSLKRHVLNHIGEKPFKCDICGKCFVEHRILKSHAVVHTGEKAVKCGVCGKFFSDAGNLKRHTRLHTGDKPFKCDVCGKCFSDSGNLKSHIRLHTGEKPFRCDICGKCFSNPNNVKRHARQHTGDKPFKCDYCEKCFSDSSNLKSHSRLHTGDKPFRCDICGKCFSDSHLKRHIRLHTGERPFPCHVCGKSFSETGNLRRHERQHMDKKPTSSLKTPF